MSRTMLAVGCTIGLALVLPEGVRGEEYAVNAAAPTGRCKVIPGIPFTISVPGRYCLDKSLTTGMTTGNAITVNASDVTLNLRGFSLDGREGTVKTNAVGIFAINRRNLTIRNGAIRGFRYGVLIADSAGVSQGHMVEQLNVADSRAAGIAVTGVRSVIRNCRVVRTASSQSFAVGISQAGSNSQLLRNQVRGTSAADPTGYAAGVDLTHGFRLRAFYNQIETVVGGGENYGIRCGSPFAKFNRVVNAETPYSACDVVAGDPDAYPYPYPYPFDHDYPYPNPYPYYPTGTGRTVARFGPVVLGGLLAGLSLLKRLGIA